MITVKVDEKTEFQIEERKGQIILNRKTLMWEVEEIKPGIFHVIHNNRSYEAEILEIDQNCQTMTIKINDEEYQLSVESTLDRTIKSMGLRERKVPVLANVCAPMPGLIQTVIVKEGQEVKKDEPLLVLKAMKMENIICSSREGIIKKILIGAEESVEKGQVLMQF